MRKKEGFHGQRTIVLPEFIIQEVKSDILSKQLYLTDIGYYPNAQFHHRIRKQGCSQFILIYCVKGEGWFSIQGKTSHISANQFFIIPPGVAHAYGCNDKNPWSIYWIHFSGTLAPHLFDRDGDTQNINPSKISRIDDRIELFQEIICNLEMGYSRENIQYANVCLLHFLASFKYISQFRQIRTAPERDLVDDSIFFMREHLSNKISLDELAAQAGLSPSHFSSVFRVKTERSPMDYLIHLRIQKACQLLDNTHLRIKEIAQHVGYDDSYYFSRIFKKVMSVSPITYRKQPKG